MVEHPGIGQPFVEAVVAAAVVREHGLGLDPEPSEQRQQQRGLALAVAIAALPRFLRRCRGQIAVAEADLDVTNAALDELQRLARPVERGAVRRTDKRRLPVERHTPSDPRSSAERRVGTEVFCTCRSWWTTNN